MHCPQINTDETQIKAGRFFDSANSSILKYSSMIGLICILYYLCLSVFI
jgi:hypothetical protein